MGGRLKKVTPTNFPITVNINQKFTKFSGRTKVGSSNHLKTKIFKYFYLTPLPLGQCFVEKVRFLETNFVTLNLTKGNTLPPHPLFWEGAPLSKQSFILGLGEVKQVKVEVMLSLG